MLHIPTIRSAMIRLMPVLMIFFLAGALPAASQPWQGAAQKAAGHAKVTHFENAMAAFSRGDGAGAFVVTLRPPADTGIDAAMPKEGSLRGQDRKTERRGRVTAAVEKALSRMPDFPREAVRRRFDNLFAFSVKVTPRELERLLENPDILTVEPVIPLEAHLAQGIPLAGAAACRSTYNGKGVAVAICDTGIDYTNPFLGGGGFPNAKVIGGYDVGEGDTDPMDGNGHGTACAGIAAGGLGSSGDYIGGVAYNARLYALKITYDPYSGSAWSDAMIAAWDWCVTHQDDKPDHPILVISTSFGGGKYTAPCDAAFPAMTQAALAARAAGITIFVSSGNAGYCNAMAWPACISAALSVGAVYDASFGTYYPCVSADSCVAKYSDPWGCYSGYYAVDSTRADRVASYANSAVFLDLLAPSNQTQTLGIAGATFELGFGGTSAACPYAAGAAAALQSAAKERTGAFLLPDAVKDKLKKTGTSVTDPKNGITTRRVHLQSAIDTLKAPTPPPVPIPGKKPPVFIYPLLFLK